MKKNSKFSVIIILVVCLIVLGSCSSKSNIIDESFNTEQPNDIDASTSPQETPYSQSIPMVESSDQTVDEAYINVKTLGITGDGTTDDAIKINRALSQYDALYFPEGVYYCDRSLEAKRDVVKLKGDGPDKSIILFEDIVEGVVDDYLFTIRDAEINIQDIAFTYVAREKTNFTRISTDFSLPSALLVKITGTHSMYVNNSSFRTLNEGVSSAVTCLMIKPQYESVSNVVIENSYFENTTKGTVGGGVFIANNEGSKRVVDGVIFRNNKVLKHSNDEMFGVYGNYMQKNFDVYNNSFEYKGYETKCIVAVSMHTVDGNNQIKYENMKFHDNEILIDGDVRNILRVGNEMEVYNNSFKAIVNEGTFFRTIFATTKHKAYIHDNSFDLESKHYGVLCLGNANQIAFVNNRVSLSTSIVLQESGKEIDFSENEILYK